MLWVGRVAPIWHQ